MWFIPFAIIMGIVILIAQEQNRRAAAAWGTVAERLGLSLEQRGTFTKPRLTGAVNGIPVRVDTYTRRSGNSSTTYTRYQIQYPQPGFDFTLRREGGFAKIGRFLGFKDVEVGDANFDNAFTVKTDNQVRLDALLTPSVRTGLSRLLASHPTVVVSNGHIGMERTGLEKDPARLESVIRRLVAAGQLLSSPDAGVDDRDVIDREQGLLEDVADRLRQAIEQDPDDVDRRIFEVETLAAAGDDAKAGERIRELETLAPADPDVTGWKRALEKPIAPTTAREVDAEAMAADLFSGNDLSFETREKFNNTYAGASISWDGVVKEARQSTRGGKVVITVASVQNDLYGNTDVDVVIETTGPMPAKGSTVKVSGMLDRIDPLMRNIYLSGASIA